MTITAKFPGTCTVCGRHIGVGDKIEWQKGEGSRHAACAPGTARPSARRSSPRPAGRRRSDEPRGLRAGEQLIERTSHGRDDGYAVGSTIHARRIAGGGGADGHYWTVLEAGKTPPNEDLDRFDWMSWAIVRPATEAEAAPVAERLAAAETRKALVRDLAAVRGERYAGTMPEGAVVLVPRDTSKLCATGERVAIVEGAILHERVGDPDMVDSLYHYIMRLDAPAELVERVRAFVAATK